MEEQNKTPEVTSTPSPATTTTAPVAKSNNMLMGIVIVVVLVILGAVGTFVYLQTTGPKDLESEEDIANFLDEVEENLTNFEGVLTGEIKNEDGDTTQLMKIDLQNKVGYYKDSNSGEEAYFDESKAYFSEEGTWYYADASTFGFDFDDITDINRDEDTSKYEYKGLVECPSDEDRKCYEIFDKTDDNTGFFDAKAALPVAVENADGSVFTYEFDSGAELEIPEDIVEDAEEFDLGLDAGGTSPEGTPEDEFMEDDFGDIDLEDLENMSEEELQEYYDQLLNDLEEELDTEE